MNAISKVMKYFKRNILTRWVLIGLAGAILIGASSWIIPHLAGQYHLMHGGQKLVQAANRLSDEQSELYCLQDVTLATAQKSLLQRSVSDFEAAFRYDDGLKQAYLLRGRAYCLLDQPYKAIRDFQQYVRVRPENPLGHLELGAAYFKIASQNGENYDPFEGAMPVSNSYTAQATFEWQIAGVTGEELVEVGDQLLSLNSPDAALGWYSRALLLQPGLASAWRGAGKVFEGHEEWLDALEAYKQAVKLKTVDAEVYFAIGQIYAQEENYEEAEQWYALAIKYNPNQARYQLYRANNTRNKGDLALAILQYRQITEHFIGYAYAYYHLAQAYKLNGQVQEAVEAIETALRMLDTPDVGYYLRAATIYEWAGLFDRALQAYRQVLAIDPENTRAISGIERLEEK